MSRIKSMAREIETLDGGEQKEKVVVVAAFGADDSQLSDEDVVIIINNVITRLSECISIIGSSGVITGSVL